VTPALLRRFHVLALLLALALPLAACGEDKTATFKKDFKPLNSKIVALGQDVGSAVNGASGKSDRQIQQQFGSLSRKTGTLQKEVNRLEPPDDLAAAKRALVDAMGNARDALGDIEKAAGAGDPQAARRATIQLVAASQDLRSERRKLARATGAKQ
jgi:hypothetical protein